MPVYKQVTRQPAALKMLPQLLLLFVVFSYRPDTASACSCLAPEAQRDFCSSNFVAVVKILGPPTDCRWDSKCYPLKIIRKLKMDKTGSKIYELRTPRDEAICGTHFVPNEKYLITGNVGPEGTLSVYLCNLSENWGTLSQETRNYYMAFFERPLACQNETHP